MKIRERLSHIARGLGFESLAESLWVIDDISSPRAEDAGWTPIYGVTGRGRESIPDFKREMAVRWARVLAASHLAGRLIGIYHDFILGDQVNVRLRAKDKADEKVVQAVNDQIDDWEDEQGLDHEDIELFHETGLVDGELLAWLRMDGGNGPSVDILDGLGASAYTEGPMKRVASMTFPASALYPEGNADPVELPVVNDPEGVNYADHEHGVIVRWCMRRGTHVRGVGILFNVIDKLRLDDKFLEADLKRAIMAGMYFGHASVKGGRKQVEEARTLLGRSMPGFGAMLVTSDNVDVSIQAAQMGLYEAKRGHEMTHRIIGMAAGIPLTWLGTGEDANRASAAEMGSPTYRHLQRRQNSFRSFLRRFYATVLEMKRQAGLVVVDREKYTVDVQLPELSTRDLESLARTLQLVQLALDNSVERNRLTGKTAQGIELEILQKLTDIELDADNEGTPDEPEAADEADQAARRGALERATEAITH